MARNSEIPIYNAIVYKIKKRRILTGTEVVPSYLAKNFSQDFISRLETFIKLQTVILEIITQINFFFHYEAE